MFLAMDLLSLIFTEFALWARFLLAKFPKEDLELISVFHIQQYFALAFSYMDMDPNSLVKTQLGICYVDCRN